MSQRQVAIYKLLVGLGILGVTVLLVVHPNSYPAGDERTEPWFIAAQIAFGVLIAAVFIVAGIVRFWRS